MQHVTYDYNIILRKMNDIVNRIPLISQKVLTNFVPYFFIQRNIIQNQNRYARGRRNNFL